MRIFLILSKILFVFLLVTNVFSDTNIQEVKIHESIAKSLFPDKKHVNTFISSENLRSKIKRYSHFIDSSKQEDYLYTILSDSLEIQESKSILFVTNYKLLKKYKNAVGAFYWKKGRPTIIFIKERLQDKSIKISSSFEKYLENEKCLYELCF